MKRYIVELKRKLISPDPLVTALRILLLFLIIFGLAPIVLYTTIKFIQTFSKSPWVLAIMGLFLFYIIMSIIGLHKSGGGFY